MIEISIVEMFPEEILYHISRFCSYRTSSSLAITCKAAKGCVNRRDYVYDPEVKECLSSNVYSYVVPSDATIDTITLDRIYDDLDSIPEVVKVVLVYSSNLIVERITQLDFVRLREVTLVNQSFRDPHFRFVQPLDVLTLQDCEMFNRDGFSAEAKVLNIVNTLFYDIYSSYPDITAKECNYINHNPVRKFSIVVDCELVAESLNITTVFVDILVVQITEGTSITKLRITGEAIHIYILGDCSKLTDLVLDLPKFHLANPQTLSNCYVRMRRTPNNMRFREIHSPLNVEFL